MPPQRLSSRTRKPRFIKCRPSPRQVKLKNEQSPLSPRPAAPAHGVNKKTTAKAKLSNMSAARVRREKQLAPAAVKLTAAVADEQAAREEVERATKKKNCSPPGEPFPRQPFAATESARS